MRTIEVYADLWCPFAYVGLEAAVALLDEHRLEVELVPRAWPLELVNGHPMDAGHARANALALRAQVAPSRFAAAEGTWRFPSTTLPALDLVAAARPLGPGTQMAVATALRVALFEDGDDLADEGVLDAVAARFAVDRADRGSARTTVLADYAAGQAAGVPGSPTFTCGTEQLFCPTLAISRDDAGLHVSTMLPRLEGFVRRCAVG